MIMTNQSPRVVIQGAKCSHSQENEALYEKKEQVVERDRFHSCDVS